VLLLVLVLTTGASRSMGDASLGLVHRLGIPALIATAVSAALYAVVLACLLEAGTLPLAFYSSFVLERRFGLSRQRLSPWLADHVRGLAIGLGLWGAAAGFIYACMMAWPHWWWMPAWAGVAAVGVALTWAAPVALLPLFLRVAPLENDALRTRLVALVRQVGTEPVDIYQWRQNDRTSRANAALVGLGRTRRVLVSDTLVHEYSTDEIEMILAHELSHHVRHDVWRGLAFEALVAAAGLWAASRVLPVCAAALGLRGTHDVAGLPVLVLTALGVSVMALPLGNARSRSAERRADRFALNLTGNIDVFVTAMRRLAAQNLAEDEPPLLARCFFNTHPPMLERITRARAWAATRPSFPRTRESSPRPPLERG
jgi:STE24 endopeptidase